MRKIEKLEYYSYVALFCVGVLLWTLIIFEVLGIVVRSITDLL